MSDLTALLQPLPASAAWLAEQRATAPLLWASGRASSLRGPARLQLAAHCLSGGRMALFSVQRRWDGSEQSRLLWLAAAPFPGQANELAALAHRRWQALRDAGLIGRRDGILPERHELACLLQAQLPLSTTIATAPTATATAATGSRPQPRLRELLR